MPDAPSPVLIEKGEDPSVLVIAFTGFQGGLTMPTFDFLALTRLTRYSRILMRDESRTCYVGGLPQFAASYASLVAWLRSQIKALAPEKLLCVGASSGAFAALLFGHALKADYVHAFSPYTYLDRQTAIRLGDEEGLARQADTLDRIAAIPEAERAPLDLEPVLAQSNGRSRYYVHVCHKSRWDLMRAKRLASCPDVLIIGYPCEGHGVAATLARNDLLGELLKIENQPELGRKLRERLQSRG